MYVETVTTTSEGLSRGKKSKGGSAENWGKEIAKGPWHIRQRMTEKRSSTREGGVYLVVGQDSVFRS